MLYMHVDKAINCFEEYTDSYHSKNITLVMSCLDTTYIRRIVDENSMVNIPLLIVHLQ